MENCSDCGLPLQGKQCEGEMQDIFDKDGNIKGATAGHTGICCDCYDEGCGAPAYTRSNLRPGASAELVASHKNYWEDVARRKKKQGK